MQIDGQPHHHNPLPPRFPPAGSCHPSQAKYCSQPFLGQHVRHTEIESDGIELLVDDAQPGRHTLDAIRPIDQIQMRHADQRPFILAPPGAADADEAIIRALDDSQQVVTDAEHAQQVRGRGGAVGEVARRRRVGRHGVEARVDVRGRQLREGARRDLEPRQQSVETWEKVRPDVAEQHVGRAAAAVGGRDGRERRDLEFRGRVRT